jgi:hypothetical protein
VSSVVCGGVRLRCCVSLFFLLGLFFAPRIVVFFRLYLSSFYLNEYQSSYHVFKNKLKLNVTGQIPFPMMENVGVLEINKTQGERHPKDIALQVKNRPRKPATRSFISFCGLCASLANTHSKVLLLEIIDG